MTAEPLIKIANDLIMICKYESMNLNSQKPFFLKITTMIMKIEMKIKKYLNVTTDLRQNT